MSHSCAHAESEGYTEPTKYRGKRRRTHLSARDEETGEMPSRVVYTALLTCWGSVHVWKSLTWGFYTFKGLFFPETKVDSEEQSSQPGASHPGLLCVLRRDVVAFGFEGCVRSP